LQPIDGILYRLLENEREYFAVGDTKRIVDERKKGSNHRGKYIENRRGYFAVGDTKRIVDEREKGSNHRGKYIENEDGYFAVGAYLNKNTAQA
jgi:hypothetical protein